MTAFYNEIDPYAAQWLRNLIDAGHIAPGVVDERSIEDIEPAELAQYTQCHFFAGIGGWSYALRLAGWPDDRPVWTGSCPCQPFSTAGKGAGFDDERHLWPAFFHLIGECRPPVVFGEQVASKDGLAWLDLVRADLEATGYALGAADLCAAGVGAPHIRQRLYWVADSGYSQRTQLPYNERKGQKPRSPDSGNSGGLVNSVRAGRERTGDISCAQSAEEPQPGLEPLRHGLADASGNRWGQGRRDTARSNGAGGEKSAVELCDDSQTNSFWSSADWLPCRDSKWRPVEPSVQPLAYGAPARVGRLRAYGNAIVPQVAQAFVEAYLSC